MGSLKEEALLMKTQVVELMKRVPKQSLKVTKEEVKQLFREKYDLMQQLIDEFLAREDVSKVFEKVKGFLRWVNQTRFEPLEQTIEDVKLFVEDTRTLALGLVDDLRDREEYKKTVQFFKDFIARENVNKTLEA